MAVANSGRPPAALSREMVGVSAPGASGRYAVASDARLPSRIKAPATVNRIQLAFLTRHPRRGRYQVISHGDTETRRTDNGTDEHEHEHEDEHGRAMPGASGLAYFSAVG